MENQFILKINKTSKSQFYNPQKNRDVKNWNRSDSNIILQITMKSRSMPKDIINTKKALKKSTQKRKNRKMNSTLSQLVNSKTFFMVNIIDKLLRGGVHLLLRINISSNKKKKLRNTVRVCMKNTNQKYHKEKDRKSKRGSCNWN